MAILKDIETNFGILIKDSYIRVERLEATKEILKFEVKFYVDKNKDYYSSLFYVCEYDVNGSNPFNQAYIYLKTLEEFKDAEDC